MPNRCQAKTKDRKPCRAFAQSNSDFCFTHDPARASERRRARLIGGYNHQTCRPLPQCDLNHPRGLRIFVKELIKDTWQLGNSIGRARALAQLVQLQGQLISGWGPLDEDDEETAPQASTILQRLLAQKGLKSEPSPEEAVEPET